MVAMFLFLVCVTSQSFGIAQPFIGKTDFESKDSRVLIFLPFLNQIKTNSADWDWLVETLSESLEKYCRDRYKYKRISDEKWKRYKERNHLKKIDLYHPETAFKMAEQLGADGIILGRFKKKDNNSIIISGQIISIIHGRVIGESVETSTLDANLFKASEKMALDLGEKIYRMYWPTNAGAAERSMIFPGWGQFYKQRPLWGYVYSGSFIASASFTLASLIFLEKSKSDYRNYAHTVDERKILLTNPAEAKREFANRSSRADQWRQLTIIGFSLTVSIYIINILDAWFFNGDYRQNTGRNTNKKPGSSTLGSKIGLQFSPPVGAATIMNGRATLARNWGFQAKLTYKI